MQWKIKRRVTIKNLPNYAIHIQLSDLVPESPIIPFVILRLFPRPLLYSCLFFLLYIFHFLSFSFVSIIFLLSKFPSYPSVPPLFNWFLLIFFHLNTDFLLVSSKFFNLLLITIFLLLVNSSPSRFYLLSSLVFLFFHSYFIPFIRFSYPFCFSYLP